MKLFKGVLSSFLSIVLVVGLCPSFAFAGDLSADGAPVFELEQGVVDASDAVLQAGGLNQAKPSSRSKFTTMSAPDVAGFEAALVAAAEAWDGTAASTTVDVSAYDIPFDTTIDAATGEPVGKATLRSYFANFHNRNGQLFYVSSAFSFSYRPGQVVSMVLNFDTSYSLADKQVFEQAASTALSGIESGWSSEQKALYLHDYLVTHCEYDLNYSNYNAYNALVEGYAVCQGYSLAYDYLLARAGIECDVITSEVINHAWNLVTIGGDAYYVDCTWDDNSKIRFESYCSHDYFLNSKSAFGHDGSAEKPAHDWVNTAGKNVYGSATIGASASYDHAWWNDVDTAIPHVGGKWAYVKSNHSGATAEVLVHDYATGSDRTLTSDVPARWLNWNDRSRYYVAHFTSLASDGKSFFASTPSTVQSIDAQTGSTQVVWALSDDQASKGYIYSLLFDASKGSFRVQLGEALYDSEVTCQATMSAAGKPIDLSGIEFLPHEPIVLTEGIHGKWTADRSYFKYDVPEFKDSDILRVTDAAGALSEYTYLGCEFLNYGNGFAEIDSPVSFSSSQNGYWAAGEHAMTLHYKDYACSVPVTVVVPDPVVDSGQEDPGKSDETEQTQDPTGSDEQPDATDPDDPNDHGDGDDPNDDGDGNADGDDDGGDGDGEGDGESKEIDLSDATVTLSETRYVYSGEECEPDIAVVLNGTELEADVDYFFYYEDNEDVGTARAIVEGDGDYTGYAEAEFTIVPGKQEIEAAKIYKVKAKAVKKKAKKFAVKFEASGEGKVTCTAAKKGKVSLSKKGKVTVKKGCKKGTYVLKTTCTAPATDNYEKTVVKNVKLTVKVTK